MRLSEAANVKATDFNWEERKVVALGKGNRYRRAVAGNGTVREWFDCHDSFERNEGGVQIMLKRLKADTSIQCNAHAFRRGLYVRELKSGLSTRVVQALGGWVQISIVEKHCKSLTLNDASQLYRRNVA